ncbi:transmembrane protein, putative (macronuclear) [Tetrahymena thermophila SB210]|uniref:Transmembrane protein, putative n=1 Tax=Tetrahymena thermophila (strain SB210) TaxID=312017 RepID=W7XKV5_TETTS|nr:transmembrane protein, putative [Tetrahymena thermophila SB210]EWS76831.1 transmembrane protein, putative [Tetrahymena thermophila SB210]|eukprot:XP_012650634.1 transmembrane protein, putative [Tetrahymena thermophila SB210]
MTVPIQLVAIYKLSTPIFKAFVSLAVNLRGQVSRDQQKYTFVWGQYILAIKISQLIIVTPFTFYWPCRVANVLSVQNFIQKLFVKPTAVGLFTTILIIQLVPGLRAVESQITKLLDEVLLEHVLEIVAKLFLS